jgi:1-acyl-sn-glycerol-3-phosphate acyltransferase
LLGGYDPRTRSAVNVSGLLTVTDIEADDFGGISVSLSGGYRLVVFPDGSISEDWRLLQFPKGQHLVVAGGVVTESTENKARFVN